MIRSLPALLAEHSVESHHVLESHEDATDVACALRAQTQPGARVLLAQRPQRSVWIRVLALLRANQAKPDLVEALAAGLLAAGFEAPRLLAEAPDLVAVSARVPAHPDPLDEVFLHAARNL